MNLIPAARTAMLLGECIPCVKKNTSRFKIKRLELDKNLLMVNAGLVKVLFTI